MPATKAKPAAQRPLPKPNPRPNPDIRFGWARKLITLPDDFFDDDLKRTK